MLSTYRTGGPVMTSKQIPGCAPVHNVASKIWKTNIDWQFKCLSCHRWSSLGRRYAGHVVMHFSMPQ